MKKLIGILLIVAGVIFGIWLGVWVCFIGGIIHVIEQVRAPHIDATILALNIAKIVFAGFIGWVSAFALIFPGVAMFFSGKKY